MMMLDPTILLLVPAGLLSLFAQWKVQSTFQAAARIPARIGRTGAEVARDLAVRERVPVSIQPSQGFLSDHFNPATDTLALSPDVYSGRSLASLGVAAHELGHAIHAMLASHHSTFTFHSSLPLAETASTLPACPTALSRRANSFSTALRPTPDRP